MWSTVVRRYHQKTGIFHLADSLIHFGGLLSRHVHCSQVRSITDSCQPIGSTTGPASSWRSSPSRGFCYQFRGRRLRHRIPECIDLCTQVCNLFLVLLCSSQSPLQPHLCHITPHTLVIRMENADTVRQGTLSPCKNQIILTLRHQSLGVIQTNLSAANHRTNSLYRST